MEANIVCSKDMTPKTSKEKKSMANIPYRRVVGYLVYAMIYTRPEIAFSIGPISQYVEDLGVQHWSIIKRIMGYLQGTATHGVYYSPNTNGDTQVVGYCNSDWVGELDGCKSTTGYFFF